jgi:hypothetical protein
VILPTKHLPPRRAIISVASEIHTLIKRTSTISSIWSDLQRQHRMSLRVGEVSYDWFILALDFLYLMGKVDYENGYIKKVKS